MSNRVARTAGLIVLGVAAVAVVGALLVKDQMSRHRRTDTWSPTWGAFVQIAITPPAERFLTLISCSLPLASVSFPTRSMAESRSSARRSAGRGTEVDRETVVDSKAASLPSMRSPPNFRRISSANMRKT